MNHLIDLHDKRTNICNVGRHAGRTVTTAQLLMNYCATFYSMDGSRTELEIVFPEMQYEEELVMYYPAAKDIPVTFEQKWEWFQQTTKVTAFLECIVTLSNARYR